MSLLVIGFGIFVAAVVVIELCLLAFRHSRTSSRQKIRKRIKAFAPEGEDPAADILRQRKLSDMPALDAFLRHTPGIPQLDDLLQQADARYSLGFYLLLTLFLVIMGWVGSNLLSTNPLLHYVAPILGGSVPYLYLLRRKSKRIRQFQAQLPEALDMLARALRAGHALSGGLKLAAEEFPAPLGQEFQQTVDEINFGVSVPQALTHMALRVDFPDLKFFVVSVILQRETGGNLAEIMETLANLIRERFKLHGKIRVLSAEGRLSAAILVGLPIVMFLFLQWRSPEYIGLLITEPAGRVMLAGAVALLLMGLVMLKKMVAIKV
jgi:tight adherence protein B